MDNIPNDAEADGNMVQEMTRPVFPLGSKQMPFRTVIIGGGPAAISVIVRAIRIGMIDVLCDEESSVSSTPSLSRARGLCVIDKNDESNFGAGRLEDYEDRPSTVPPEMITGTILEPVRDSLSSKTLQSSGSKEVPLSDVGLFLKDVGSAIRSELVSRPHCRLLFHTEATALQQTEAGCRGLWRVRIDTETETESAGNVPEASDSKAKEKEEVNEMSHSSDDSAQYVYTQHVIMASGGVQRPPLLFKSDYANKVMCSDFLCTGPGIAELRRRLLAGTGGKNQHQHQQGRVLVIGGSHSAFSSVWILLNKLVDSTRDSNSNDIRFAPGSICILHRGCVRVFYNSRREAETDGCCRDDLSKSNNNVNDKGQINAFGGLRGDAKRLYQSIRDGHEPRVKLLSVKSIFTSSDKPHPNRSRKSNNILTTPSSATPRPSLLHLTTLTGRLFEDATVVVWACGYSSNTMSILDPEGRPIPIYSRPSDSPAQGQVEVDNKGRLLRVVSNDLSGPSVVPCEGLFGTGLGFGLRPELFFSREKGKTSHSKLSADRADGISVYVKRAASLVLGAVLGSRVFGPEAQSWEERVAIGVALRQASLQKPNESIDDVVGAAEEEEAREEKELEVPVSAESPVPSKVVASNSDVPDSKVSWMQQQRSVHRLAWAPKKSLSVPTATHHNESHVIKQNTAAVVVVVRMDTHLPDNRTIESNEPAVDVPCGEAISTPISSPSPSASVVTAVAPSSQPSVFTLPALQSSREPSSTLAVAGVTKQSMNSTRLSFPGPCSRPPMSNQRQQRLRPVRVMGSKWQSATWSTPLSLSLPLPLISERSGPVSLERRQRVDEKRSQSQKCSFLTVSKVGVRVDARKPSATHSVPSSRSQPSMPSSRPKG
eukprot:gene8230-16922_t